MQPTPFTFLSVSLESWLTVAAIVIGPLAALMIQRHLDRLKAKEDRKVTIFRTLMANRASRLSAPYVQALNAIETEFYGVTKVIEAWRALIEHTYQLHDPKNEAFTARWNERMTDLSNELLTEMADALGYHFDKVTLKRNAYSPTGWVEAENEQTRLRQAAMRVFEGQALLKVEVKEETFPPLKAEQPKN